MISFQPEVISWFAKNQRDLPWRKSTPWGVMVSEFMLQQTPVSRVLPKWEEWMQRWPTASDLAKATPAEIITAWGRLGYPRRALRLHECAKVITNEFDNQVPRNEELLRQLPGVGDYTAAAIAAFAYQERTLVLDINIRRLFSRAIDGEEFPSSSPSKVERGLRDALIPENTAHIWAAATMELGALVCTSRNPACEKCPISTSCRWRANGYPKSTLKRTTQKWHGTDRQCRGTVIQALRDNPSLSVDQLKNLWPDESQIEKALQTLLSDKLLACDGVLYFLPSA